MKDIYDIEDELEIEYYLSFFDGDVGLKRAAKIRYMIDVDETGWPLENRILIVDICLHVDSWRWVPIDPKKISVVDLTHFNKAVYKYELEKAERRRLASEEMRAEA